MKPSVDVMINGERKQVAAGATLLAVLAGLELDPRVVVEFLRRRQPEASNAPAVAADVVARTARSAIR